MTWKIPLFKIYWDEEDVRMVSDVIKVGMNWQSFFRLTIRKKWIL
ncbi:MAG: hypothetical protein WBC40_04685 [Halobacteriota archaeon]